MNKEKFTDIEIQEIEKFLNEEYLRSTGFLIKNLRIEVEDEYFFQSQKREDTSAYVQSLKLELNNKELDFSPLAFVYKTTTKDVAFHIAHEIWSRFDGKMNSPLWKNL